MLLIGSLATLATLTTAARADVKIYSGHECVVLGEDQSVAEYVQRGVRNNAQSYNGFYCPVVLDNYAVPESAYTWIYLLDQNVQGFIGCNLRSQNSATGSMYFKSASTTNEEASTTPYKKVFAGDTSYFVDGLRYIYCLVPGKSGSNASGIVSYSVNEG
jgi:hypothetical protein